MSSAFVSISPHILLSCGKGHFQVSPKWSQFTQHMCLRPLEFSTKVHFVGGTLHWAHIYTRSSVISIPTIREKSKYDYIWDIYIYIIYLIYIYIYDFEYGRTVICCFDTIKLLCLFFLYCREGGSAHAWKFRQVFSFQF